MKAKHIIQDSIVKYNGRLGRLGNVKKRNPLIVFSDQTGAEINSDTDLEVVLTPAQLANLFLEHFEKEELVMSERQKFLENIEL